jgi:hypothetical protein
VTLSSTGAAYASLSEAAKATAWLREWVAAMRHPQNGGTVITQDNTGIATCANGAAKIVGDRLYHVYNMVDSKQSITEQVGTKGTLADIMAIPISGASFKTSRSALKICSQNPLASQNKALERTCFALGIGSVPTRCTIKPSANQQSNVTAPKAKRDSDQAAKFRKHTLQGLSKAWWNLDMPGVRSLQLR